MATTTLDITVFRSTFSPQFDDTAKYSDAKLNSTWTEVGGFMTLNGSCGALSDDDTRQRVAYLLLAHLLIMDNQANSDSKPSPRLSGATEKNLSGSFDIPQSGSAFKQFCNDSGYGRRLYALLSVRARQNKLFASGRTRLRPN